MLSLKEEEHQDQYTYVEQQSRIIIKGFQSLFPQNQHHHRNDSSATNSSQLKKFVLKDQKNKWKKKIKDHFQGFDQRIQKVLRKRYEKNPPINQKLQIELLRCKTSEIQAKHEVHKVKMMKNTQHICFEEKKWIGERIDKQIRQQLNWINNAVQKANQFRLQIDDN